MDRNYDAPATRFALEILRNHPQISYEHAVSAAGYSGVGQLPRRVFFDAAERLGIAREPEPPPAVLPEPTMPVDAPSTLLRQLDQFREQMTETATVRDALLRMRTVVRAALAETEV